MKIIRDLEKNLEELKLVEYEKDSLDDKTVNDAVKDFIKILDVVF